MLKYALPLIPTSIFWWLTTFSDHFMVASFLGYDANGIYAASYKIPTIMVLISGIFMNAWQVSAIVEDDSEQAKFYENVFSAFSSLIFTAAAAITAASPLLMRILVSEKFLEAEKYVPLLCVSMVFSCFLTFFGTIYMVHKKSLTSMFTLMAGAILNIILNFFMIPILGIYGAAISTAISYIIIFILRVVTTKKYMQVRFSAWKIILDTSLLVLQGYLMIKGLFMCSLVPLILLLAHNLPQLYRHLKVYQHR
jgi:O-antigen/teichoic acid export membrane protein